MKSKLLAVSATVIGSFLTTATFAATSDAGNVTATIEAAPARIEAPAPIEVVQPTRLSYDHEGKTFNVALTIDEHGRAHNIRILSKHDDNVRKSLVAAMKQWQFKPATRNGTPFTQKVILPVQLI